MIALIQFFQAQNFRKANNKFVPVLIQVTRVPYAHHCDA